MKRRIRAYAICFCLCSFAMQKKDTLTSNAQFQLVDKKDKQDSKNVSDIPTALSLQQMLSPKPGYVIKIQGPGPWRHTHARVQGLISLVHNIKDRGSLVKSMWGMRYLFKIVSNELFHSISLFSDKTISHEIVERALKDFFLGDLNYIYSCCYDMEEHEPVFIHAAWMQLENTGRYQAALKRQTSYDQLTEIFKIHECDSDSD